MVEEHILASRMMLLTTRMAKLGNISVSTNLHALKKLIVSDTEMTVLLILKLVFLT